MESISRISSILEAARDLTLEAARDAGSVATRKAGPSRPLPPQALKKLLDSRRDADVLDGLRRVLAMSYSASASAGEASVLPYFSAVVKNIASPNIEVKKLVYAFLVQHAESAPDTALLSINTIQKSLSDPNAQTRALALRTMSSIRVPVISQIVALGIKRGAGDMSPHVRRAAALAIPKCYRLDPSSLPLLMEQLTVLLGDKQYFVAGAAVMAYMEICPERIDLIHVNYRGLVRKLVDMDEWGQLATLSMILSYARKCFPRRTKKVKKEDFYNDQLETNSSEGDDVVFIDADLDLFFRASQSLLQSRNSAVIVAVARCYLYLGTASHVSLVAGPLVSILRAAPDIQAIALNAILDICRTHPIPFVQYATHFLLRASDPPSITTSKLNLQSLLFPHVSPLLRSLILTDLAHHTRSPSAASLVRASVLAIGRCAHSAPTAGLRARCLRLLLSHLSSPDPILVSSSLDEIRKLIQLSPSAHEKTIIRLAKRLDALTAPQARAAIVWLVGEFAASSSSSVADGGAGGGGVGVDIAADVLRILLRDFASEAVDVQAQILLLAAKVYLHHHRRAEDREDAQGSSSKTLAAISGDSTVPNDDDPVMGGSSGGREANDHDRIAKMLDHAFLLARYSQSYVLRDRARFLRALVLGGRSTDLAALLLLAAKPGPRDAHADTDSDAVAAAASVATAAAVAAEGKGIIGSASSVLGVRLRGSGDVPPWTEVEVGAKERAGAVGEGTVVGAAGMGSMALSAADRLDSGARDIVDKKKSNGVGKTLDEWLDEKESSEEDEDDEEEEDDDDEEESEEEGTEDEEETESGEEAETDEEDEREAQKLLK